MSSIARALVLRAPGINRDSDMAHACRLAGFDVDLVHINQLIKEPGKLLAYHLLALPGGFSYGDDLGAGTLLAKNLSVHLEKELHQFIAEERLVLGLCNGFQALVRAGLLPGSFEQQAEAPAATLTHNDSARFECRWVKLAPQPGPCIFTRGIEQLIEAPVAHGEGRFILADPAELAQLRANGQAALLYAQGGNEAGEITYPANPNGSLGNIAGVCNARGNVFGMMPHPENHVHAHQHPNHRSSTTSASGEGSGLLLFKNAYNYAQQWAKTHVNVPDLNASASSLDVESGLASGLFASGSLHATTNTSGHSYAASGVNIAAADNVLELIKCDVRSTQGPEVQAGMGAFAGVFLASALQEMRRPAIVASTDGVGTKTLLASQTGRFETIGHDIVNHSLNDLLTQKAKPLFFMDYVATGKLAPTQIAAVVKSVAVACKEAGCALLGGETAEMPGVYHEDAFDLAGTIVGAVDLAEGWRNGASILPGDVLLGLPSNGLHTNGYSLARRVFAPYPLAMIFPELGESLADALLRPHRCYLRELETLHHHVAIKGMAHITGGGFPGNVSRILPAHTQAVIDTHAWQVPPLFQLIARLAQIEQAEMYGTFNMGVGMVLALAPETAAQARSVLPELLSVGYIAEGRGVIVA